MTSRENLKKLSKPTLQKMCLDTGIDIKGKKKDDLVDSLFMKTLPPAQITPVINQSSDLTGLMPQIHQNNTILPPFDKCIYANIPYAQLPSPSFISVYHFMISRSRESCQDRGVHNFKGMDRAVSHFEAGDVQDIQVAKIDSIITYIKAQCLASMKKDKYTVYLCLTNEDLKIHYAYCQCPIGLAQSCSHVGAVLLALNGKERLKTQDIACTSQLCKWVVPRSNNPIPQPIAKLDFGKPKAEGNVTTTVSVSTFDPRHPDDRENNSAYLSNQLMELKKCFPDTGIAHLWDIGDEVPEAISEVIIDKNEDPICKEIEKYIYSKGKVAPLTIATSLVKKIEGRTRGQRLSPLWHDLHKGRITSSIFGKVLRAGNSPNSLIKNIIEGSNLQKYNTPPQAVQWGQDNEDSAKREYVALTSLVKDVSVEDTGITLCESHSFLGASSDGRIFETDGEGVLEIKCPFSVNGVAVHNMQIDDIINLRDKSFCLVQGVSGPQLRHDHDYYAQVQGEMAVMGLPWCDFVVWTNAKSSNIFIERILFDEEFVKEMMPKLVAFYVDRIFPNL